MVTLLAIVVLGGGAAYAGTRLGRNSVGARQLKRNAVTSAKVKNHSLKRVDLARGILLAGPQGPEGARGPQGQRGPAGASHVFQASGSVNYTQFSSSPFGSTVVTLPLPPGSYFAVATVEVQTVNSVASGVECRLINGSGGSGSSATTRVQIARADTEVDNMTLAAGFTVTDGQDLSLQCSKLSAASSARVPAASIVAVGAGGVTGTPQ
jgi:hypothetical protein